MNYKEEYNNYLLLSKYSPNTYYIYNKYAEELFMFHPQGLLSQNDVNKLIAKHNHRVYRAFIKSYLSHFNMNHLKVPRIRGRIAQKRLKYLTKKEINILIRKLPQREAVLIELMFMTGLRVTEAVSLCGKDIDQDKMTVKGVGKGNKEFEQPITQEMFQKLYNLAVVNTRTLDKTIFYYDDVKSPRKKALYELQKNAKELLGKHVTPHMIRHSCGTYLREKGWDLREVQEFLRHSKLETTKIYTHVDSEKLKEKWGELFK
jgi:site-specific recombinase XerD|tara:strand:+ start:111 stop:890 length:780 start_codon:yes stop_codon:yes gene_type:complete